MRPAAIWSAGRSRQRCCSAGGDRAESVHVGTEDGEVFAVRHGELAMVAVSERFTLASLMLFDMRMALRELAA